MQVTAAPPLMSTLGGDALRARLSEIDVLTRRRLVSHDLVGPALHLV